MFIKSLTIKNLKCFGNNDNFIKFKIPKKEISGSGLNILVGKNNSGKSTILEAIKYAKNYKSQQVDEEIINSKSRNNKNDLEIKILSSKNKILKFKSCLYQSDYRKHNFESEKEEFAPNLYHSNTNRYIKKKDSFSNLASRQNEGRTEEKLEKRDVYWMIQEIEIASDNQRKEFDKIISDYFSDILRIQIGSRSREDSCRIFCEMKSGDSVDLQDMGSGIEQLIILIWIIKYGSKGEIILIDEPELSLHPQAQKNFLDFLKEESRIKQIFISTHSPYFIDVNIIQNVLRFENNNLKKGARSFRIKKKKFVDKIKENRNFFFHHRTLFFTDVAIFMEGAEDYDRYSKFCENNGFSNLIDSFYMMNGCDPTLFFEEFC
ncbi:MAG: AAA family ATPase, partial [Candidatus Taylorbacteria bacterium]|nr:AAA family ATPase [Candidatus Taylorbacteria bacterium]